ncbi:ABC transporter substrate-binding protein [Robbsia sp. KACC 23696]|uniref:ABC transporter substrate-binding protein n=1 Tax=Robbsia sp. KACC 23696 TaxID=3149231 RepID=UPI00325BBFB6
MSLLWASVAPSARALMIKADVTRIAAVDRAATETLLALGIRPVAVAAPDVYAAMKGYPPLPDGIANVGYSVEPNLEVMLSLGVQLTVMEAMSLNNWETLARIAPVFVLNIFTEGGQGDFVEVARSETFRLARALGREDAAALYWQDLQQKIAAIRQRLVAYAKRPIFIAQFGFGAGSVLLYGKHCVTFDVMRQLGFENVAIGSGNPYGTSLVGLDQLSKFPEADICYIDDGVQTQSAMAALAQSPVWRNLPMVRAGRVYPIAQFDPIGALPTALQFAENFDAAIRARGPQ